MNYAPVKGPDTSIPSTSIDEQGPLQHIKVYPNPASDVVFVEAEFAHASEVNLQLSNAHGQVVKKLSHQAFIGRQAYRLELNDLAGGLYFLSVIADGRISYSTKLWVK